MSCCALVKVEVPLGKVPGVSKKVSVFDLK